MATEQFAYLSDTRGSRVSRPGGARPPPPSTTRSSNTKFHGPASVLSPDQGSERHNNLPGVIFAARGTHTQSEVAVSSGDSASPGSNLKDMAAFQGRTRTSRVDVGAVSYDPISMSTETDHNQKILLDESDDGFTDERDRIIYDQALDEAQELMRDHRNGFLPHKPRLAYRYRFEANPADRSTSTEHDMENASVNTFSASEATSVAFAGNVTKGSERLSGSTVGSGRRIGLVSATTSDASPNSKTQTVTRFATSPASVLNTAAGSNLARSATRDIGSDFDEESSANKMWVGSVATEIGTTSSIGSSRGVLENRPIQRPIGPFNPASRAKYRSTTKPIHSTLALAQRRNPLSWVDIHKNPPSQSRNPLYTTNSPVIPMTANDTAPRKNGMEIRADYIRQATRVRLKDRSPKLPTPTAVSDDPGRPIVSFDSGWYDADGPSEPANTTSDTIGITPADAKPAGSGGNFDIVDEKGSAYAHIARPSLSTVSSVVPQIHITIDEPTKGIQELPPNATITTELSPDTSNQIPTSMPSIYIGQSQDRVQYRSSSRPLPTPCPSVSGNSPWGAPSLTRAHGAVQMALDGASGSPRNVGPTHHHASLRCAPTMRNKDFPTCHECRRPIEGRFVSLAGTPEQFHPQCFSCVTCGTSLEALEIHPEPEPFRRERLDRIWRRAAGHILEEEPGKTMAEDGDERLRFYCHLDWHELYAPKCKHCRTPILGEHIVALGAHWHQGHFFCAECGDPFENDMTHIEKDGYAWCIKCQTRMTERRAPKCRKCKEAVIGNYVVAMGGEWHDNCFRCISCNSTFDDGQIFPKTTTDGDTVVLCTQCRATELKH